MKFIFYFMFAFLGLGLPSLAAKNAGYVKVIDGDSLMVGTTEVRLEGIDAPEYKQKRN